MEIITIPNNIAVVFLTATNFPMDVPATYEKLNSIIPSHPNRRFFGISHPNETGAIQYKAAAEILPTDNFENTELKNFTIEKGEFVASYIVNHFKDSKCIGDTFEKLLKHPRLDPKGYCLEVYQNYSDVDVHCMVRILP
jgi:hypothetical protein